MVKKFYIETTPFSGTDVVGAKVTVQEASEVESVSIVNATDMNTINSKISSLETNALMKSALSTELAKIDVNAKTLDGKYSSEYALSTHNHDSAYAPLNHASNNNNYGMGNGSQYGHVMVKNNLTTNSSNNGWALHANQGKILNDKFERDKYRIVLGRCSKTGTNLESFEMEKLETGSGTYNVCCKVFNRWTGENADTDLSGKSVKFLLNGNVVNKTLVSDSNGVYATANVGTDIENQYIHVALVGTDNYNRTIDVKYLKNK